MQTNLTKRELQVIEVVAWGAARKEVPGLLPGREISVFTVDNLLRSIYVKLNLHSLNGLSAWYFAHRAGVSTSNCPEPLRKRITATMLLAILCVAAFNNIMDNARRVPNSARVARVCRARARRGKESTFYIS